MLGFKDLLNIIIINNVVFIFHKKKKKTSVTIVDLFTSLICYLKLFYYIEFVRVRLFKNYIGEKKVIIKLIC